MPFTVTMPKLSPTMTEGVVAKWHKHVGDRVEAGEVLLEISTDKATVEHSALDEGYLRAIIAQEGASLQVNDPLAVFTETADESIEGYAPKAVVTGAAAAATPAPQAKAPLAPPMAPSAPAPVAHKGERVLASPLAKKLAKDKHIDLYAIKGTGPSGRIMSRDLERAPIPIAAQPATTSALGYTVEALSPLRQVIAARLTESKTSIPHFYVRQEVDATAIVSMREELKRLDRAITVNDLIIKAVAVCLKKHPEINSGYDAQKKSALRFSRVDISIAVTVPGGLITPIVFDASNKSLSNISQEVKLLAAKAREGKLQPTEYQGGSFTISNLGMFGIDEMTAIINPPQGAILGVGAASDAPIIKNGQVVAGKKMTFTLSCDHRVIDGAEAAQFMRTLKTLIENPILFLSE